MLFAALLTLVSCGSDEESQPPPPFEVNDWSTGLVVGFSPEGNFINNYITGLSRPEGVAYLDNGQLLIGNGGTGSVKRYNSDFTFDKDLVMMRLGGLKRPNAVVIRSTN